MEAERKLEGDLLTLFGENQALKTVIRRLDNEKNEAEEKARIAMNRIVVRSAINDVDVEEMRRLRERVRELEMERTHLWERLFIKMKSIPKRELGSLIAGYFESFKCSIISMKNGQDELMKKNEKYVTTIRGLQQENENLKGRIEQLEFDIDSLNRKLKSAANTLSECSCCVLINFHVHLDLEAEPVQLRAPLKPIDNSRPSFFVRPKDVEAPATMPNMSSMHITPQVISLKKKLIQSVLFQKPSKTASACNTIEAVNENTSEWAERREKAKAEKKQAATPATRFNFIQLTAPKPKFKPATLMMPSSDKEN